MKELEFLEIIGKTLTSSKYLGDDCAYLEPAKIYITQDTLVEDVHFSRKTTTAFELGQKAVAVNISDLCTTLGTPKWITISISLPKTIDNAFVKKFYEGVDTACREYSVEVVGGDITGAEKITISVCAIAQKTTETRTSRGLAKPDDVVAIAGVSGASALGLYELTNTDTKSAFTSTHLIPRAQLDAAKNLQTATPERIASMDTSDGLADALYKISKASGVTLTIDGNTIPTQKCFVETCQKYGLAPKNLILYGGEDFALLATMEKSVFEKLDKTLWTKIGTVKNTDGEGFAEVKFDNTIITVNENTIDNFTFDHFKEKIK